MEVILLPLLGIGVIIGAVLALSSKNNDIEFDKSVPEKVRELPGLFEAARTSIKIATDFDTRFFDTEAVRNAIEKALGNGVKVQFICEAEPSAWYKDKDGIEIKRVEKVSPHVMMIDGLHIRLETPHEPLQFGKRKEHGALVFRGFPALVTKYNQEFDTLWIKQS